MRIGQNPNRQSIVRLPAKTIAAVITHLPHMTGYHQQRFDVVRLCLESMRRFAGEIAHEVLVWDNGSCEQFRMWLTDVYKPNYLMLSRNIGKTNAVKSVFSIFPADTIIAMSDDDILFYPGWLEKQVALLDHFDAALVSGYPVRTAFRWGIEKTVERCRKIGVVEVGRFIPDEWERDFAISIGRDPSYHKGYTEHDVDYRVTYNGMTAYCTGHHCQFVAKPERILPAMDWSCQAMGSERGFDVKVDLLGLRLCTTERLARHIGNILDEEIVAEIKKLGLGV